jgi:c-di-GMP-binding flagellar brake protein YcgR
MWQGVDRRRFPRADYSLKITVIKKGGAETLSTHTENIGVGGVCVILDQELSRFSEVGLILILADNRLPIHCRGRIVWTVKRQMLSSATPGQVDTGIEFIGLKEKDKLKIERIIEECLQKQKAQGNN